MPSAAITLAHYGSIDRLIQEAGHTDLRTTKDHYLGLVSAEAAARAQSAETF